MTVLVLSELLTNAQLHTHGDVVLAMRRTRRGIRLSVTDADPRVPTRRDTDLERGGGFGLHILDTLTAEWGVRARRGGKTVWADIEGPVPEKAVTRAPARARCGAASIRAVLARGCRAGTAGWAAACRGVRPPRLPASVRRRARAVCSWARGGSRAMLPGALVRD
ncbi:hypothetical protein B4N89_36370 [Embleya scabrispora]|uniref:Histidine kinase/HSP90-like ATPase domain-containing protein n=1 Tax=Embleya scabrispora TaxID=159449 RepID=A0A1T3NLW7_9ACTN|nr:ATP-binding protein [Embleya scabrispora]OPC77764.1 hypothetical protein B4N89_36370 [Embleya scabrispora]